MAFIAAVLLSFGPAFACVVTLYWLDRFEREPKLLVGAVFLWGAFVATLGALLSQLFLGGAFKAVTGSNVTAEVLGSTVSAPLTEEGLKGLAVLIVFAFFRREFDSLMDGLVYAGTVALGFAASENVLYLYFTGFGEGGWGGLFQLFVLRIVMGAWDHPFFTAFTGMGLAAARLTTSGLVRFTAPLMGLGTAMGFHALHNGLATLAGSHGGFGLLMLAVDWSGWLFMACVVLFALNGEARMLRDELREEFEAGWISSAHYRTACSSWAQTGARLRGLFGGRFGATREFYHLCGELAHKKHQWRLVGDEGHGDSVQAMREELHALQAQAVA